jgi:hypothetical protein
VLSCLSRRTTHRKDERLEAARFDNRVLVLLLRARQFGEHRRSGLVSPRVGRLVGKQRHKRLNAA